MKFAHDHRVPDEYRTGQTAGENITLFASGITTAIHEAEGDRGSEALRRFSPARFLFRSSEIGQAMVRSSSALSQPLGETLQLVDFGGGALAASALSGAVDLTAATLCRLLVGQPFARDPDREADVDHFPGEDQLPPAAKDWLEETRAAPEWLWLKALRDRYLHRWFPMHITITLGAANLLHEPEINGVRRPLPEILGESRAFVIDRLVSAGLLMNRHARDSGSTP